MKTISMKKIRQSSISPDNASPGKGGFTLIEILLYVSIASILMLVISAFLAMLLQSRVENQVRAEVDGQAQQVMQEVGLAIRNAEDITSPTAGNSGSTLVLDVYAVADDPTTYTLSSGQIQVTEGAGSAIDLTSTRVSVSALTFTNITKAGTPGTVRVEFTITYNSSSARQEYDYTKTYYATYNLRQP
ncbi:type II secretion system protein J [Patescibacteria group bacterium]